MRIRAVGETVVISRYIAWRLKRRNKIHIVGYLGYMVSKAGPYNTSSRHGGKPQLSYVG